MWLQSPLQEVKSISCFLSQTKVIAAFQIQEASAISFRTQDRHEIQMFADLQCLLMFSEFEQGYGLECAMWCLNEQECTNPPVKSLSHQSKA